MILALTVVLVIAVFALPVLFFVLRHPRFMGRSIDEVAPYLVMVNDYAEEIDLRLDPKWQEELKDQPGSLYRDRVRRNIRFVGEMFERKRENVEVLNELARTEYFDHSGLYRMTAARLNQLKADHRRMQSELEDLREPADADGEGEAPLSDVTWLMELEESIDTETAYCEEILGHLDALKAYISLSGRLLSALYWPVLKLRLCSLIPYDKWTLIPIPRLASFSHSRGIDLQEGYKTVKSGALDLINRLYPGAEIIRQEIESQV